MKIFITGTAGFIGFSLAKALLENNHTFMVMMELQIIMILN